MNEKVNQQTIVIYCKRLSMGGTETLILRLLEWYKGKNCRVILLTEEQITNPTIIQDAQRIEFEHYVFDRSRTEFMSDNLALSFDKSEVPLVITQYFPEFFRCHLLLDGSKYGCQFRHVIYIVHPFSTFLCSKKMLRLGRRMINVFLRNGNLVFMDEICLNACLDFYKLSPKNYRFKILRLPVFVQKEENQKVSKKKSDCLDILTVSRFEFPFKGYVLGLIESFARFYSTNPNSRLTIIGYGKNKQDVDNLMRTLPIDVASAVRLLDQVPSYEVSKFLRSCDVYVGMGTTVLDAANNCKLAIVAVGYQNDGLALGFFHENYSRLGEIYSPEAEYRTFDQLLFQVASLDQTEFDILSMKSKMALTEHYDIDTIAADLFRQGKQPFNTLERLVISSVAILNIAGTWVAENIYLKLKGWMS